MTTEVTVNKRLRWIRPARRALAVLVLVGVALLVLTPTGRYLLRAGWEEGKILARRKPIHALLAEPGTKPLLRGKLQLVLDARSFAHDSLGLATGNSFTTYSRTDHDTLVLLLSAAYRDKLKSFTWWFPIVGSVPYKGYFDFDRARRDARDLTERGFDTRLAAASAFSTLGWFNDPLLPTTLSGDSLSLAETVIHELTHNTFYAPGGAVFNESFANFVGSRGAERFFRGRGLPTQADEQGARWQDDKITGSFWASLYARIDSVFKAHPGDDAAHVAERIALRDSIYREARVLLVNEVVPQLRTISPRAVERIRIDNAVLMSRRVYLTSLDDFDAVLVRHHGDLRAALHAIIEAVKKKPNKPFETLRELAFTR